jgi:hypothetical protein
MMGVPVQWIDRIWPTRASGRTGAFSKRVFMGREAIGRDCIYNSANKSAG